MLKSLSSSSSSSSSLSASKSLVNNNHNHNHNGGKTSTIRSGYRYHRIPATMAMDTGHSNNNDDDDDDDDDVDHQNNSNVDHNDDDDQQRTTTTTTTSTAKTTTTKTTTTTIDDPDDPRSTSVRVQMMKMVANNNHNDKMEDNHHHHHHHHCHHHHHDHRSCCIRNFQNYMKTILNMIRIPSPILLLKFVKNIRCLLIFIFFVLLFVIQFKSGPFNNYHYTNTNHLHHDHHPPLPQPQLQLEERQIGHYSNNNNNNNHNNDTTNHGQASRSIIVIMNLTNNQVINDDAAAVDQDGAIIPLKISKTSSSSAASSSSSIVATVGGSISNKDDHHHHNDNGDDHEIKSTNITNNERLLNTTTTTTTTTFNQTEQLKNCPLVPPNLVGRLKVLTEPPEMDQLELMFPQVELGGRFRPKHCHSHDRVAIIVPYRDRDYHLRAFLLNLHPMLMRQNIDYAIYIVEQYDKSTRFNRAKLMNVGFLEAGKQYPYDCYIFHDVDLIPEDDRNLYTCPQQPRHMSVAIDKFHYRLPYKDIFGGVSALTKEQFQKANGFSNEFWGWGGEDDDMSNRIRHYGFNISRYPTNIARYKMLKHENGVPNSERFKKLYNGWRRFKTDGINTIKYRIVDIVFKKLYTWIHVDLLEPKRPYSSRHHYNRHYGRNLLIDA